MANSERRTIPEILARYEFEPDLKDVYVEGSVDKSLLEGIFEENGIADISIFEISSVVVPNDAGEDNNNRTRVIKLAKTITECPETASAVAVCIIDTDFDELEEASYSCDHLLRTDYANLEMYFYTDDIICKLLTRILYLNTASCEPLQSFIRQTLGTLFSIRFINSRPKWKMKYLDFEKSLKYKNNQFSFDTQDYLMRYLNKNGRLSELDSFVNELTSLNMPGDSDFRSFIHGHDFLRILCFVFNSVLKKQIYLCEEAILDLLKASSDYSSIVSEPMFVAIRGRFGINASHV